MKYLRLILFTFAALWIASATPAQQLKVSAFIPFDFVAGDRTYSAGEYWLDTAATTASVAQIHDVRNSSTVVVMSNKCETVWPSEETKLVFHRMGDTYFLYQVWIRGHLVGLEFPRSKTEMRMAQNHTNEDTVILAANQLQ